MLKPTIAATGAEDGRIGLFHKIARPDLTQIGGGSIDGSQTEYEIYTTQQHTALHSTDKVNESERTPLLTRAWCLQEELLSPSVIHFTKTELIYECFVENVCECPYYAAPTLKQRIAPLFWEPTRRRELWAEMVREYSTRSLSDQEDRLVAISGVVTAIQMQYDEPLEYVAGIFKEDLPAALLWMVKYDTGKRPKTSRLSSPPSWSWASVESTMIWWSARMNPLWEEHYRGKETRAEMLNCECTLATADPYGGVIGGRLLVRGLVFALTWMASQALHEFDFRHAAGADQRPTEKVIGASVNQDVDWEELVPSVTAGDTLCFVPMVGDSGLMLRKLGPVSAAHGQPSGEIHFSRIAYAVIVPADISYGQQMDMLIL